MDKMNAIFECVKLIKKGDSYKTQKYMIIIIVNKMTNTLCSKVIMISPSPIWAWRA